jgi:hypothetical protein
MEPGGGGRGAPGPTCPSPSARADAHLAAGPQRALDRHGRPGRERLCQPPRAARYGAAQRRARGVVRLLLPSGGDRPMVVVLVGQLVVVVDGPQLRRALAGGRPQQLAQRAAAGPAGVGGEPGEGGRRARRCIGKGAAPRGGSVALHGRSRASGDGVGTRRAATARARAVAASCATLRLT